MGRLLSFLPVSSPGYGWYFLIATTHDIAWGGDLLG